jgi:hypothetical protein
MTGDSFFISPPLMGGPACRPSGRDEGKGEIRNATTIGTEFLKPAYRKNTYNITSQIPTEK